MTDSDKEFEAYVADIEALDATMRPARAPRRYIRDNLNPHEFYQEVHFPKRYRFAKATVTGVLLPLIVDSLMSADNRGLPILPIIQLLIALRFYATASYQRAVGDLITTTVSQSTCCKIIHKVSLALARLLPNYIRFPQDPITTAANQRKFFAIAGFPGVAGYVDGCHIKLDGSPGGDTAEVFRNRKGYFSLNVQAKYA